MAFTHEDGSGVPGANAYALEAEVTDYLTDRGREAENGWNSATTAAQQAAIIKATDYVEIRFAEQWRGVRGSTTQGLSWPRRGAVTPDRVPLADDALPVALIHGTAEYAVRALAAELLADPTVPDGVVGPTTRIREQVGPVLSDVTYSASTVSGLAIDLKPYPAADRLLEPLTVSSGMFGRVARA